MRKQLTQLLRKVRNPMTKITWQVPGCDNVHTIPEGAIVTLTQGDEFAVARIVPEGVKVWEFVTSATDPFQPETSTFEFAGKRDQLLRDIAKRVNELFKPAEFRNWNFAKLVDLSKAVDELRNLGYTFKD